MIALVGLLGVLLSPSVALAEGDVVKLALTPIGSPGLYFDLTMRPGETQSLAVRLSNAGTAAIAARTYAADVYTIINGGFGGLLRDDARTGTTKWLDYPTVVLQLPAGQGIQRKFTVAVPPDAGPGEYITSLVLENDEPISGDGSVSLDQIVLDPRPAGIDRIAARHRLVDADARFSAGDCPHGDRGSGHRARQAIARARDRRGDPRGRRG